MSPTIQQQGAERRPEFGISIFNYTLVGFGVPIAALCIVLGYNWATGTVFADRDFKNLAVMLWMAGIISLGGLFIRAFFKRPPKRVQPEIQLVRINRDVPHTH